MDFLKTNCINVNIALFILVTIRYFSLLCPVLTNGQHDLDIKKEEKKIYHSNIKNKLGGPAASIYYSPSFTSHDRSHSNTTLLNPAETVKIT